MNTVKFRPIGQPSGQIITAKCSQSKRAHYARYSDSRAPSIRELNATMLREGYVRVNGDALK